MENSTITDHGIFYHCRKLHQVVCHDEYLMRDYGWHDDKVRSRGKRPVTGQVSRTWYLWQGDVAPLTGPYPYGILKRDDEDPAVADFASAHRLPDCRHCLLYILPFYWFILLTLPLCQLRVQNYYIMTTNHTKAFRFDWDIYLLLTIRLYTNKLDFILKVQHVEIITIWYFYQNKT